MRILITNNHLADLGGTETWVMTMVKELAKNHEVGVFTHVKGYVSNLLSEYIDDNPSGYDLALINHNSCFNVDAKCKIFTSHGIVPELEIPPIGMDYYVAVNENVSKYFDIPHIIKNPIDTTLFYPRQPISPTPKSVLSLNDKPLPIKSFQSIRTEFRTPDWINEADLVVSMGRGVLEAMSCARNVIVWDDRPYWGPRGDGYLDDLSKLKGNVAGEYKLTSIDWNKELSKYDPGHGERNRKYIIENHEVSRIVKEYLSLC